MHRREHDIEWMDEAACLGEDPELFFPVKGGSENAQPAKKICKRCDVRDACLEYAKRSPELIGIWGETTEKERAKERAKESRRVQRLGGYATKKA